MIRVPLNDSKTALVDDCDAWVLLYHWRVYEDTGYVYRQVTRPDGRLQNIRMHREIMGAPAGKDVDHVNGNRTDNRRKNLRVCSRSDNLKNKTRRRSDNKSGVTGVFYNSAMRKWTAQIQVNRKPKHLGLFTTLKEAATARRAAEKLHYGAFAPRRRAG